MALDRFIDSDEAQLLSGYPATFTRFFPSLTDASSDTATSLIETCTAHILSLKAEDQQAAKEPDDVEFFPIADPALPSLVIKKGVKVKSVPMRADGTYDLEGLHFGDAPSSLDDSIKLHLRLPALQKWVPVLQNLIWGKVRCKNLIGALLVPFL